MKFTEAMMVIEMYFLVFVALPFAAIGLMELKSRMGKK
jgi:hypothetical protein